MYHSDCMNCMLIRYACQSYCFANEPNTFMIDVRLDTLFAVLFQV